jgi:hypothetical protein
MEWRAVWIVSACAAIGQLTLVAMLAVRDIDGWRALPWAVLYYVCSFGLARSLAALYPPRDRRWT